MAELSSSRAYREYLRKKQRGVPLTEQDFTTSVGPLLRENYQRDIAMSNIASNRAIADYRTGRSFELEQKRIDEAKRQFDEQQAASQGLSAKDVIAGGSMLKDVSKGLFSKGLFKPAAEKAVETGVGAVAETGPGLVAETGAETATANLAVTGPEAGTEALVGTGVETGVEIAAETATEAAAGTVVPEVGLTTGLGGAAIIGSIAGIGVNMLTKAGMPGHMGGERWTGAIGGAAAGIALLYAAVQLGLMAVGPIGWVAAGIMGALSGSGTSVICTELNRQGLLSDELLLLDTVHANKYIDDETYQGYLIWAEKVVYLMQKSRLFTRFIVRPLAMPCINEMASRVDPRHKGSILGKIMLKVGVPVCRQIGRMVKAREVYHGQSI